VDFEIETREDLEMLPRKIEGGKLNLVLSVIAPDSKL